MKKLLFTQRVEIINSYHERRDCADQNIARFIRACGYIPIPLSNISELIPEYIKFIRPDGIILTGGNDLREYGGNAPERDCVERLLLDSALQYGIPLLGYCRGMQLIATYFGAKLEKVTGHVATRHMLLGQEKRVVNSYHNYGITELPEPLKVIAQTDDGVIEACKHSEKAIVGIMWHPERENPFERADIELVQNIFQ